MLGRINFLWSGYLYVRNWKNCVRSHRLTFQKSLVTCILYSWSPEQVHPSNHETTWKTLLLKQSKGLILLTLQPLYDHWNLQTWASTKLVWGETKGQLLTFQVKSFTFLWVCFQGLKTWHWSGILKKTKSYPDLVMRICICPNREHGQCMSSTETAAKRSTS